MVHWKAVEILQHLFIILNISFSSLSPFCLPCNFVNYLNTPESEKNGLKLFRWKSPVTWGGWNKIGRVVPDQTFSLLLAFISDDQTLWTTWYSWVIDVFLINLLNCRSVTSFKENLHFFLKQSIFFSLSHTIFAQLSAEKKGNSPNRLWFVTKYCPS